MMGATIDLSLRRCVKDDDLSEPFTLNQAKEYLQYLDDGWDIVAETRLHRDFTFDSFMDAMVFVNDVAAIAEDEGHHPDICVYYKKVALDLTTHAINGLSENDFILARKVDLCC